MTTYGDQDDNRSIVVGIGQSFGVRLSENPTTGYRWHLQEWDTAVVEMTRDEFHPPDTSSLGAPGGREWEFLTRARGEVTLRCELRRGGGTPSGTFSLHVSVR